MIRMLTTMERSILTATAVAMSALTIFVATVVPASADQSMRTVTLAKSQPSVEVRLVSFEPATRVN